MAPPNVSLNAIEDFLAQKRIAIVGISRERPHISIQLFEELSHRGYDVVPVNPNISEIFGQRCFARVQDIHPIVDAALLLTSPTVTDTVVRDCAEVGIRRIWMYRAGGQGSVSDKAMEFCRAQGIALVPGQCPFMFLPGAKGVHRFHGFIRKISGKYPRHLAALAS